MGCVLHNFYLVLVGLWNHYEILWLHDLSASQHSLQICIFHLHLRHSNPLGATFGRKHHQRPMELREILFPTDPRKMGLFCFFCHQPRFVQTSQAFSVDHVSTQGWEPHSPTRSKTSRIYNLPLLTAGIERIHIKYIFICISWIIISYLKYINHTSYMNQYTHLEKTVLHTFVPGHRYHHQTLWPQRFVWFLVER